MTNNKYYQTKIISIMNTNYSNNRISSFSIKSKRSMLATMLSYGMPHTCVNVPRC